MTVVDQLRDLMERETLQVGTPRGLVDRAVSRARAAQRRRRAAGVVGGVAMLTAAAVVVPSLAGSSGVAPSGEGDARPTATAPRDADVKPVALDADGCPPGATIVRASDDTGSTALVRGADTTWVCSGMSATADGPATFFSSPWNEVEQNGTYSGIWLTPLSITTCAELECDGLMWSAVGTAPAGVDSVTIEVEGEATSYEAVVEGSMWAVRLERPATDEAIEVASPDYLADTMIIRLAFAAAPDDANSADEEYAAVTAAYRAMCESALASTPFPAWNELACTDELLAHNLGTSADDFEASIRFDAQCEWYAEYLTAADTGQQQRAADALVVLGQIATWPGYAGTKSGALATDTYERVVAGDLTVLRQQFPTADEVTNCSGDYLDQAAASSR